MLRGFIRVQHPTWRISQPSREGARDQQGWTSRNGVQFPQAERTPHKVVDDGYYQDSMNSVLQTSYIHIYIYISICIYIYTYIYIYIYIYTRRDVYIYIDVYLNATLFMAYMQGKRWIWCCRPCRRPWKDHNTENIFICNIYNININIIYICIYIHTYTSFTMYMHILMIYVYR